MIEQHWTKSSYSQKGASNCLEARTSEEHVLIRDTQHRYLGHLEVPSAEWRALLGAVRRGELG